jgi:hypothetical protein
MEQDIKIDIAIDVKTTFEVKDASDDCYTLEVTYKEIKMNTIIPGMGNLTFDSNTPENVATMQDLGPMLKAIVDKPIEVILTSAGKVESVKGTDKLREAVENSFDINTPELMKQQLISQFGSQISDEHFKSFFSQCAGYFPSKPVKTGDSWNYKISTTASNFTMDFDTDMTLKSIDDNIVTLDIAGTISTPEGYETDMNGMKAKTSLKGDQNGWVKIDRKTGWIISSETTQNFAGDVEVMGMQMHLSTVAKTVLSDK